MSDKIQINPVDESNPTLEEEAALQDQERQQETEAASEQQQEEQSTGEDELLAGKYKSVEELVKAHKELESKLGSKDNTEHTPELTDEADGPQEEKVNNLLEKVGITRQEISQQWESNDGKLSDEAYQKFEELGVSRELVDEHVSMKHQLHNLNQEQAKSKILSHVGGQENYSRMGEWAVNNLSEEERDVYNTQVASDNLTIVEAAVKGLHARFKAAGGVEPSLKKGSMSSSTGGPDVYQDMSEVQADINDPRYESSKAFRHKVEQRIKRSDIF